MHVLKETNLCPRDLQSSWIGNSSRWTVSQDLRAQLSSSLVALQIKTILSGKSNSDHFGSDNDTHKHSTFSDCFQIFQMSILSTKNITKLTCMTAWPSYGMAVATVKTSKHLREDDVKIFGLSGASLLWVWGLFPIETRYKHTEELTESIILPLAKWSP